MMLLFCVFGWNSGVRVHTRFWAALGSSSYICVLYHLIQLLIVKIKCNIANIRGDTPSNIFMFTLKLYMPIISPVPLPRNTQRKHSPLNLQAPRSSRASQSPALPVSPWNLQYVDGRLLRVVARSVACFTACSLTSISVPARMDEQTRLHTQPFLRPAGKLASGRRVKTREHTEAAKV